MRSNEESGILTLTKAEAFAITHELLLTDACSIENDTTTREGCDALIRRVQLEAAIRDGGGWWGDSDPRIVEMVALGWGGTREPAGVCPEFFTLTAEGAAALVELLPTLVGQVSGALARDVARQEDEFARRAADDPDEVDLTGCMRTLEGLAERLGVELPEGVTA